MRFLSMLISLSFLSGCATVEYTHRHQLLLVSTDTESQLGVQAYADVKTKNKISTNPAYNAQVDRVGRRIAAVANRPDFQWEFTVIDDPKTVNAFCLPGGKVAVYTGILPLTKDDNGLAVVLSHEVSHALARHGAERMSQQMAAGVVEQAAVMAGLIKDDQQMALVQGAYGIGYGLPHSRTQESEADHIGLILMAKAGYDPRNAVPFWDRMKNANSGGGTPAFLSDHPSDDQRIADIQSQMPEALTYYKP